MAKLGDSPGRTLIEIEEDNAILAQVEPERKIPDWDMLTPLGADALSKRDSLARPGTATLVAFTWARGTPPPDSLRVSGSLTCSYCGTSIPYKLTGNGSCCTLPCRDGACSRYDIFIHKSKVGDHDVYALVASVVSHKSGTYELNPQMNIRSIVIL